ncbi:MAG: ECF-type sigma factor [Planctomycetota bacterium]
MANDVQTNGESADSAAVRADGAGGSTPDFFGHVYSELRDLAHSRMTHEKAGLTLQTTALVHEVYLRLMKNPEVTWENPRHFFGAAAEAMRRILIERARRYATHKRGGGRKRVDLDGVVDAGAVLGNNGANDEAVAMLELNDALSELEQKDERMAEVVKLRYFGGLSVEETAAAIGGSSRTVKRDWAFARAWLAKRLDGRQEPIHGTAGDDR